MSDKNPYDVLGVSPNATDDEIKTAYRDLARKYHPDKFNGTDLAELAEEKMKEVNAAYEEIQNRRKNGDYGKTGAGFNAYGNERANAGYNPGANGGNSAFTEIRRLINDGNYKAAEDMLKGMPNTDRTAEWYFLLGCVLLKKGYLTDAARMFDIACSMDPNNDEYTSARDRLRGYTDTMGQRAYNNSSSADAGRLCSTLLCADCCCEAMGGDCIRCC